MPTKEDNNFALNNVLCTLATLPVQQQPWVIPHEYGCHFAQHKEDYAALQQAMLEISSQQPFTISATDLDKVETFLRYLHTLFMIKANDSFAKSAALRVALASTVINDGGTKPSFGYETDKIERIFAPAFLENSCLSPYSPIQNIRLQFILNAIKDIFATVQITAPYSWQCGYCSFQTTKLPELCDHFFSTPSMHQRRKSSAINLRFCTHENKTRHSANRFCNRLVFNTIDKKTNELFCSEHTQKPVAQSSITIGSSPSNTLPSRNVPPISRITPKAVPSLEQFVDKVVERVKENLLGGSFTFESREDIAYLGKEKFNYRFLIDKLHFVRFRRAYSFSWRYATNTVEWEVNPIGLRELADFKVIPPCFDKSTPTHFLGIAGGVLLAAVCNSIKNHGKAPGKIELPSSLITTSLVEHINTRDNGLFENYRFRIKSRFFGGYYLEWTTKMKQFPTGTAS